MDEKDLFLKKFEDKLKNQLDKSTLQKLKGGDFTEGDVRSSDYENFRSEALAPSVSIYEKLCNFSEKNLGVKPDQKIKEKVEQDIYKAHLHVTPTGVMSFTMLATLTLLVLGMGTFLYSSTIGGGILMLGLAAYFVFQNIPSLLANRFKSKANDQVIIAIFYIVAYMRFNSNFELAVSFAANYLNPPLSLDFKRLLWDLDNSKYPNLKAAFDDYLEDWRDDNLEFLEAIYLVESSLYESDDTRRITLLDKSLDIILQGNYEKMLHFAQELRGKVQTFNMIGVVLPILGLIILPLAASFGNPKSVWEMVFLLYNILLPIIVGYFGFTIIFNRPSGVNSIKPPKNLKNLSNLQKYPLKLGGKTIHVSPKIPALTIFLIFFTIGLSPLLVHSLGSAVDGNACETSIESGLNKQMSYISDSLSFGYFQEYKFIDDFGYCYGPYGTIPGLLSTFIPLSFAFGIGYLLRYRYKNLIHLRDKTKNLEKQFPSATFQLGNRINEGISAELAFGAVAETMKGTEASVFFSKIDANIKFNGMSVEASIFDPEKGAINEYPSDIIISSMKILIRAIEKGPEITAKTLLDLSRYLNEIHLGQERMKDLLAESISSMKGQANFLAPAISGIVISIVSLVTMIMGSLAKKTEDLAAKTSSAAASSILGDSIPTFLFQSVVGFYVVILIGLLVYMVSNLENGEDPIFTKYQIGEKLIKGMVKYSLIVVVGIIGFSLMGEAILPK